MNFGPETFENVDFNDVLGEPSGQPAWLINDVLRDLSGGDGHALTERELQPTRPKAPMRSSMNIYRNYSVQHQLDNSIDGKKELMMAMKERNIEGDDEQTKDHNEMIEQLLFKVRETQRKKREKKEMFYNIAVEKRKRFVSLTPRIESPKRLSDAAASPIGSFSGTTGSFKRGSASFKRYSTDSNGGYNAALSNPSKLYEASIIDTASGVVQYNMDVLQAREKFIGFIVAAHTATLIMKVLRIKIIGRNYSAIKIQRRFTMYRYMKAIKKLRCIQLPIRAAVKMKIMRKNRCADIIRTFMGEYLKEAVNLNTKYLIKTYCKRIRSCQRYALQYIRILRARCIALDLLWEKYEKRYRQKCEEREQAELEATKKIIAKRVKSGKMTNSIHHKWEKLHTNVQQLLYRADLLSLEGSRLNGALTGDTITEETSNAKDGSTRIKAKVVSNLSTFLDRIAPEERRALIKSYLRMKRKKHIELTDERKIALIKAGEVGIEHAKLLISFNNSDEVGRAAIMSHLVKLQLETATNPEVIKARRKQAYSLFVPLTSNMYGESWKELVQQAVNADITRKKR